MISHNCQLWLAFENRIFASAWTRLRTQNSYKTQRLTRLGILIPERFEEWESRSGMRDILFVGAFYSLRHVPVAVINFVNLLHAGERFFPFAYPLINKTEIIHDLLFHRVH